MPRTLQRRIPRVGRVSTAVLGAAGMLATALVAGPAAAAGTGTELVGEAIGNCRAAFTLTNYTNSTYYQPDWWFASEGLEEDGGTPPKAPPPYDPPWRVVNSTGTDWAFARWIGNPPLHSEVGEGVARYTPGGSVKLSSTAQPDGKVSTATIDVAAAENPVAPPPSAEGTHIIWYRIGNGTSDKDRVLPKSLVVTGCKTPGGNGSHGGHGSHGDNSSHSGNGSMSNGSVVLDVLGTLLSTGS